MFACVSVCDSILDIQMIKLLYTVFFQIWRLEVLKT